VSGIASLRSPSERFYCLERKYGLALKFRNVKSNFFSAFWVLCVVLLIRRVRSWAKLCAAGSLPPPLGPLFDPSRSCPCTERFDDHPLLLLTSDWFAALQLWSVRPFLF
jgi:hypothetical protein